MKYKIFGETMPVLIMGLEKGEKIYSESGNMAWMTDNIIMSTSTRGLMKAVRRVFAGESVFLNTFEAKEDGIIAFNSEFPGRIIALDIEKDLICQKDAFMCAAEGVDISIHIQKKIATGLFGGEGFVLQKLSGKGKAFLEISGEVTKVELKKDQDILVDTGHIAMYEPTVDFNVEIVRGGSNILFGGEGIFLARLSGPGKVWLQSLPIDKFAGKIGQYIKIRPRGGFLG